VSNSEKKRDHFNIPLKLGHTSGEKDMVTTGVLRLLNLVQMGRGIAEERCHS